MRRLTLLALLGLLLATDVTAWAGRTGQAKSAQVLAKRTAASPRGGKEWGGKSMAFIHETQKTVRKDLRRAQPGSDAMWEAIGRGNAAVSIRNIVGKHLGLTPGQLASKDRRHDRAVLKQLRRMVRQVRTARANGIAVYVAFPATKAASYFELERQLADAISAVKLRTP